MMQNDMQITASGQDQNRKQNSNMADVCFSKTEVVKSQPSIQKIQIQIHPSQRLHLGDQRQATSLLYSVRLLKQKCFETSLERRLIR